MRINTGDPSLSIRESDIWNIAPPRSSRRLLRLQGKFPDLPIVCDNLRRTRAAERSNLERGEDEAEIRLGCIVESLRSFLVTTRGGKLTKLFR